MNTKYKLKIIYYKAKGKKNNAKLDKATNRIINTSNMIHKTF